MPDSDADGPPTEVGGFEESWILLQVPDKGAQRERMPNEDTTDMQSMQVGASIDAS